MTAPGESEIAAQITAARGPLLVRGAGTKLSMLRPVRAAGVVSATHLSGISLYAPKELIVTAWAGTPLHVVEAALAGEGQHLIAEPPDLSVVLGATASTQTIGGVAATNLSGPRRVAWGAMRDHVMGIRAVTGRGEVIHSGGRVLKNVTGLDLCKLFTGSHGTLGVITQVTLKVLPAPDSVGTIVVEGQTPEAAVATLAAALGSPFSVSGAAWLPPAGGAPARTLIRIEDFAKSVAYRTEKLREQLGHPAVGILDDAASRALWRAVRDVKPLPPGDAVWRVSVRPSEGPAILRAAEGLAGFLDWGGGLVWLSGPADAAAHGRVEAAARAAGGTWTLMRAPDALRESVSVIPPEPAPLAAITRRVKQALDPRGILNPGRMYADL